MREKESLIPEALSGSIDIVFDGFTLSNGWIFFIAPQAFFNPKIQNICVISKLT